MARNATNDEELTLTNFPERDEVQRMKHILSRLEKHVKDTKVVLEHQEMMDQFFGRPDASRVTVRSKPRSQEKLNQQT